MDKTTEVQKLRDVAIDVDRELSVLNDSYGEERG